MMVSLQKKFGSTMDEKELETFVSREEDQVIAKLKAALRPCVGVDEQLEKLQASGKYKMAVVSSSALRRVKASIEKVNQDRFFAGDDVFSAATSLPKPTSKPNPAIYIFAMEKLGVKPIECIAIEDSKSGTGAGVAAKIRVVGYVGSYEPHEQDKMRKVLSDAGADPIMSDWSEFPSVLAQIEGEKV
jgi:HAD superfamily hydrolase (TIGR01509 family)